MKKRTVGPLHCLAAIAAAVAILCLTACAACAAVPLSTGGGDYRLKFTEYSLFYDVHDDRSVDVTETISVQYLGRNCTGFLADIPVNAGEQVRNITVSEITDGRPVAVDYAVVIEDNDFISVDIGDTSLKYDTEHTYVLNYVYCMTSAQEGADVLELNAVSTAHNFEIDDVNISVRLPAACIEACYYVGKGGSTDPNPLPNDKTLSINNRKLGANEGLTLHFGFDSGVLGQYFDMSPYYCVIAAAALLVVIVLVKILFFNKHPLSPVVHYTPPKGMDPLLMGKLIDNKVNGEDVTSLIFYWAGKGYVKINFDNKDDPVIIRVRDLPATSEGYEKVVFARLFKMGDSVKTSDLKYAFYATFKQAADMVNEKAKGLYMSSSIGISVIFALLGGLVAGLAPFILAITQISNTLTYFYGFIALIPALVIYGFSETILYNKFKNAGKKTVLFFGLIALGIALCTTLFAFIIPSSVMAMTPKILTIALSFIDVTASVFIMSRTADYNEKLNDIVGFRDFILDVEKDKLETLLESDPQYYYHILPYAQVLNVSDKWENKFAGLTVAPPEWAVYTGMQSYINFTIMNDMIRRSTASLSAGMIARPSASGQSGGFGGFGGFGGGHVGGGHGGTGFRGR